MGLHESPDFPDIQKELCLNMRLAYRETSEKDIIVIKLAQNWAQWKAFVTILSSTSAVELSTTEAAPWKFCLVGWTVLFHLATCVISRKVLSVLT